MLNLVMAVHRRAAMDKCGEQTVTQRLPLDPLPTNVHFNDQKPLSVATTVITPAPSPPQPRSVTPEDPTKKALAELAASTIQEVEAARQADRKTASLEQARQSAIAESERRRRREMLVKQQVSALADRAGRIDQQIDTLAAQRDALARERDVLKAAVASTEQSKGSYAVLPYKGPNGSWRRPIVLECSNGTVTLRPKGPTFTMLDLSAMLNPRSSPVILAIARELLRVQKSDSPDGSPVVPYFVFLVRPDGIRPYYEIRARLEPLGIAFGYELIDQNLEVDVPDFDNLATWDGTIPLVEPLVPAPAGRNDGADDGLAWPSPGAGSKKHFGATRNELPAWPGVQPGDADTGGENRSPDDSVWSSQRGTRSSGGPGVSHGSSAGMRGGPGLTQGTRAGSFSDRNGSEDGRTGSRTQASTDSALKPWPFPNQGSEKGLAEARHVSGAAGSTTEGGSPRGGFGSETGSGGVGGDQGVALLPNLEPAGNPSGSLDQEGLAGGLAGAVSGARARNGLPVLDGPDTSGTSADGVRQPAPGPGTDSDGTGTGHPRQAPPSGACRRLARSPIRHRRTWHGTRKRAPRPRTGVPRWQLVLVRLPIHRPQPAWIPSSDLKDRRRALVRVRRMLRTLRDQAWPRWREVHPH